MSLGLIKENIDLIKAFKNAKHAGRRNLIAIADNNFVKCLACICYNTLKGKIPLDESLKRQMKRHKSSLRLFSNRSTSLAKKKKHLVQTGGSFLYPILVPAIARIIQLLGEQH